MIAFTVHPWRMVPIQMKAATTAGFSIERKYARIDRLVMVYVWNSRSAGAAEFYALTWPQAIATGDTLGWTRTKSWREKGEYTRTKPSARLRSAIEPYRMTPGRWAAVLFGE